MIQGVLSGVNLFVPYAKNYWQRFSLISGGTKALIRYEPPIHRFSRTPQQLGDTVHGLNKLPDHVIGEILHRSEM